jgi:hypothetical protein
MAAKYWFVAGNGSSNWNAAGVWYNGSGGTGGTTTTPTTFDDAILDANSGSGILTGTTTMACNSLDLSSFTGTFTGVTGLNISNSVANIDILKLGGTFTYSGSLTVTGVGGKITCNGRSHNGLFTFNSSGTWDCLDTFSVLGTVTLSGGPIINFHNNVFVSALTVSLGTINIIPDIVGTYLTITITSAFGFTAGNFNTTNPVDYGLICNTFASTGSTVRTMNMGNGYWKITGTGTCWNLGAATNLTLIPGNCTIEISDTANPALPITFAGGGFSYGKLLFNRIGTTASSTIQNNNTFRTIQDLNTTAHSCLFQTGTITTVENFLVSGMPGNLIIVSSTGTGTHSLIKSTPGVINCDYLNLSHSVATPASTWFAGVNSVNNQGISTAGSGWIFTIGGISKLGLLGVG